MRKPVNIIRLIKPKRVTSVRGVAHMDETWNAYGNLIETPKGKRKAVQT
jgi:hypothetical protein